MNCSQALARVLELILSFWDSKFLVVRIGAIFLQIWDYLKNSKRKKKVSKKGFFAIFAKF